MSPEVYCDRAADAQDWRGRSTDLLPACTRCQYPVLASPSNALLCTVCLHDLSEPLPPRPEVHTGRSHCSACYLKA